MAQVELNRYEWEALPPICMRCGRPAEVWLEQAYELPQELSGPVWIDFLPFVPRLMQLFHLGQSFFRPRITLRAPFCGLHRHHWRWRKAVIFGGIITLLALFLLFLGLGITFKQDFNAALALGILFLAFLIWCISAAIAHETSIHATAITPESLSIQGVCVEFVAAVNERR